MSAAVVFESHHCLPQGVRKLEESSDPDLAFLNYIIDCFELRTNIRPTVFIRYVPEEYISTIDQVIHNISNALKDVPVLIPCTEHTCIENTTPVFDSHTLRKTEKPIIFGLNLLALLKQVPTAKLRAIRNFFRDRDDLGHFWFSVIGSLAPPAPAP